MIGLTRKKRFRSLEKTIVQNIYETVGTYTEGKATPFQKQRLSKAHFFEFRTHGRVISIPGAKNGYKKIHFRLDIPEEKAAFEEYDTGIPELFEPLDFNK